MQNKPPYKPFKATIEQELVWKDDAPPRSEFRRRYLPQESFSAAYKRGELTLQEMRPYQEQSAWRLVRTHALAKSQLSIMEPLAAMGDDMWDAPMPDASPATRSTTSKLLGEAWAGLSLLPNEENRRDFVSAVYKSSKYLRLNNSPRDPLLGDVATYGFGDERTILTFFPTRDELIDFEQRFVSDLVEVLLYRGQNGLISELVSVFGFSRQEATTLVPLTKHWAVDTIESDPDMDRKLMIARTEGYLQRALDSGELRAEIQGLKHLSVVQQLSQIEPSNPLHEFKDIIISAMEAENENNRLVEEIVELDRSVPGSGPELEDGFRGQRGDD